MFCVYYYDFGPPVGQLGIAEDGRGITNIFMAGRCPLDRPFQTETPQIKDTAVQLREFFAGKRTRFALHLTPHGTEFQEKVWSALMTIPYGETRSYKDIAAQIGVPKGFQAIGQANGNNPIPFCIPCHRVIAANGTLGGYSLGLDLKQWLLDLEHSHLA